MMWDRVMARVIVVIQTDLVLSTIFGDHVRMATASGDQIVPGLEYTLVGNTEGELWEPIVIQFDLWTLTAADQRDAERRMRQLFHKDLPQTIDTVRLWTVYTDGTMLATPDRSTYLGRALRFQFTPLREQYAALGS